MHSEAKKTSNQYNLSAENYEKKWHSYLIHTHRHLLENLQTQPGDIILDPSCGTGLLAQQLIAEDYLFEQLVLNDIAGKMLQKAQDRLQGRQDISFSQKPVRKLDFERRFFTKILCLNSFHNYFQQQQVLNRFGKLLQPGGQLYLLDWNNSGLFRPVNWLIKQWAPEHIETRSLSEMKQMLDDTGFQILNKKEWFYRYWKFYLVKAEK